MNRRAADAGSIPAASTLGLKPKMDRDNRYIPRVIEKTANPASDAPAAVGSISRRLTELPKTHPPAPIAKRENEKDTSYRRTEASGATVPPGTDGAAVNPQHQPLHPRASRKPDPGG
jgi:hypothetical protein